MINKLTFCTKHATSMHVKKSFYILGVSSFISVYYASMVNIHIYSNLFRIMYSVKKYSCDEFPQIYYAKSIIQN